MDNKAILESLLGKLYDVGDLLNELMENDAVRKVDKQLLKNKLANLYDDVSSLETDIHNAKTGKTSESREKENPADATSHIVEHNEPAAEEPFEWDKNTQVDSKKEKIKEKIIEETKAELESKLENKNAHDSSHPEGDKRSLHDELVKRFNKPDISSKLQHKPIKDLHKAIGLNERYTFVQELFNADPGSYTATIDQLNKMHNFNEAFEYVQHQFDWDFNSPLVQHLLNLMRRKYISSNND